MCQDLQNHVKRLIRNRHHMPEDCDESFSSTETLAGIRAFREEISGRLGHGGMKDIQDIIHSNMGFVNMILGSI